MVCVVDVLMSVSGLLPASCSSLRVDQSSGVPATAALVPTVSSPSGAICVPQLSPTIPAMQSGEVTLTGY